MRYRQEFDVSVNVNVRREIQKDLFRTKSFKEFSKGEMNTFVVVAKVM
jgi:hypothetical protein